MRKFLGGGIGMLVVFGIGMFWLNAQLSREPDVSMAIAFTEPSSGLTQIHIAIPMGMPRLDPPEREKQGGAVLWIKWVDEHFDLLPEAGGDEVPLRRSDFSDVIPDVKAGTPEFYLIGRIEPGKSYKLDYTPVVGQTRRFRHVFSAPNEKTEMSRPIFEKVSP